MKLLVVTCLKEYQKSVAKTMDLAGITVFSVTETIGFKDDHTSNLLDNWFSSGGEQFDSIFLFSFTDAGRADQALSLIAKYNSQNDTGFPIRAFVLAVEKSS
jgi:hypothetical protein